MVLMTEFLQQADPTLYDPNNETKLSAAVGALYGLETNANRPLLHRFIDFAEKKFPGF